MSTINSPLPHMKASCLRLTEQFRLIEIHFDIAADVRPFQKLSAGQGSLLGWKERTGRTARAVHSQVPFFFFFCKHKCMAEQGPARCFLLLQKNPPKNQDNQPDKAYYPCPEKAKHRHERSAILCFNMAAHILRCKAVFPLPFSQELSFALPHSST